MYNLKLYRFLLPLVNHNKLKYWWPIHQQCVFSLFPLIKSSPREIKVAVKLLKENIIKYHSHLY